MGLEFNTIFRNSNIRSSTGSPLISVQKPKKLLNENRKSVQSICESAGIAKEPFEKLYHFPMDRVAGLVQSCPATETDHHAWPGGLLTHILESCDYALRLRKGVHLPISGSPEERKPKADLYTYAVFSASLLGEIGALLHRQKITLYSRGRSNLGEWNPLANDIDSFPKARYLKIEFRRDRVATSRSLSLMYAARVLPSYGLQWIETDPLVLGEFLQTFSDCPGGPIHDLVVRGRRASIDRAEPISPVSNDGRKQRAPIRKKKKVKQPAGTKDTGQSRPTVSTGRRENQTDEKPKPNAEVRKVEITDPGPEKRPVVNQEQESRPEYSEPEHSDGFMAWLEQVIKEPEARSDQNERLFYLIDKGIFLVYPTIFAQYATEKSMDRKTVQRDFVSLGIHVKNTGEKDSDLWKGRLEYEPGKATVISGWVVPQEHFVLEADMAPDSKLVLPAWKPT